MLRCGGRLERRPGAEFKASPFDSLLHHVRSLLSLFLPLLTTMYCTFIKRVALSPALALASTLVRIIP
jgi:hypothetical protein